MKLNTLFKRTKTGAIQFWKIEVIEASPANYGWGIIKTSGQLGTDKPIVHRETITKGKNIGRSNETTPLQQAESQAMSDWRGKKDEGYKSLEDLGFVMGNPLPANPEVQIACFLEGKLPQFNTTLEGNPKPMLALDYTKVKNITYPCYIQPKLDGVRCLMIVNTEILDGETPDSPTVKFLSRSGKEYTTLNHIADAVLNYITSLNKGLLKHTSFILDGEIYSHNELSFQSITSAVKKQSPDSLKLQFRAYDIVNDAPQSKRWPATAELIHSINSPLIQFVPTFTATNKDEVKLYHDNWVKEGYEGAMLRLFDGIYGQGQRSRHLLKVKEFQEEEFEFIAFEKGQRDEDLIAICRTPAGIEFKAKMIGTVSQKQELFTQYGENKFEEAQLTVKFFGYTEDGSIRFPIGKGFRNY